MYQNQMFNITFLVLPDDIQKIVIYVLWSYTNRFKMSLTEIIISRIGKEGVLVKQSILTIRLHNLSFCLLSIFHNFFFKFSFRSWTRVITSFFSVVYSVSFNICELCYMLFVTKNILVILS